MLKQHKKHNCEIQPSLISSEKISGDIKMKGHTQLYFDAVLAQTNLSSLFAPSKPCPICGTIGRAEHRESCTREQILSTFMKLRIEEAKKQGPIDSEVSEVLGLRLAPVRVRRYA
jgi:hypothetical protein